MDASRSGAEKVKTFDEVVNAICPPDGKQTFHDIDTYNGLLNDIYASEHTDQMVGRIFCENVEAAEQSTCEIRIERNAETGQPIHADLPASFVHILKLIFCNGVMVGMEMEKQDTDA